nr:uncharacterized protein LOC113401365 isoform X3 [Vanessa tameamea]
MKSLSATALLTLAVIAECLGAQDRSRQRSGSSRSVPKTANIKRDTDFDCPEEFGYYPHPTDCTLYYVCVFGGALLESCTGGLMYSHELQTCDWPRNVGCDATGAVVAEDLERLNEREPPLYPPRRNPPPPPRTQPNPIITSRGQPKFNRQEYEQQQQLYAEVDDLPPVEEIENDRQQRVYRGQPSTIGQVQKDRDGYGSQAISSGRTLNSNIIPASINQNSKIGSFSFGTQVDERRTASLTQAPQTYRGGKYDDATDSSDRPIYFSTDTLKVNDIITNTISRKKREIRDPIVNVSKTPDELSKRHDNDEVMEYIEFDEHSTEDEYDEENLDESERGKRQIRFYVKNGHKIPTKNWQNAKPLKILNFPQFTYNPNIQSQRFQPIYQTNNYDGRNNQKPYLSNNNYFTLDNAFPTYSNDNSQTVRPFKASMPDPSKQTFSQNNAPTQIITKSPPISSLLNNQNPFSTLVGGFYNNILKGNDNRNNNNLHSQSVSPTKQANLVSFPDSSLLSSSIVTGKPIQATSSTRVLNNSPKTVINNEKPSRKPILMNNNKPKEIQEQDYDEDDSIEEEENSSEEEDENNEYSQNFQPDTSHLPYGYTNPSNKYANIQNPFANPNFNFDSFLAKLQENHYSVIGVTTKKPTKEKNPERVINSNNNNNNNVFTTVAYSDSGLRSSTLKYKGISTPKPFTMPASLSNEGSDQGNLNFVQKQTQHSHQEKDIQRPQNYHQSQQVTQDQNYNRQTQKGAGFPLESLKPRLKPPNFNDDRQLPISHSFNAAIKSTMQPTRQTDLSQYLQSVTQKPYTIISGTGSPIAFSTPNNYNIVTLQTNLSSRKPYITSTISPMNGLILSFSQSTPNPLSNIANQHLSTLQQFWNNPSTDISVPKITLSRPNPVTETPNTGYKSLPIQISTQMVNKNVLSTNTTNEPPKRKPIPKPSPEMNDYYYDEEDEQYYYEPVVKPKYMPSSEIKPQRPPMAQNYQEYEDTSYDEDTNQRVKPENSAKPNKYYPFKQEAVTKNHNDVSVVTKTPYKQSYKNVNGKIPVPVMMVLVNFSDSMSEHPDVSGYRVVHNNPRNRTVHLRKPIRTDNRPNTVRPPKYLNHTTLRPYTLRHRLAKPTTEKNQNDLDEENKKNRGRVRHHNIVAQMLFTTPRDSYKQETRFTKTNHDDRTNRLEPTESITPTSYTATPRPKMLYNGSQTYSPDQYDPYYAVYDEDGELYKDTDYVQHYNTASLRPAVQQTYRGTPPPVRRPVETYSPRPVSPDDYDDALIQGQISNQNQYQSSVRQPARSSSDENRIRVPVSTSTEKSLNEPTPLIPSTNSPIINFSSLAKPFERTDNSYRLDEPSTEKLPTRRLTSRVTNSNRRDNVKIEQDNSNEKTKKMFSLSTGFSFRRNVNNTKNPYTLTLISKPFDEYSTSRTKNNRINNNKKQHIQRFHYDTSNDGNSEKHKKIIATYDDRSTLRRKDISSEANNNDDDISIYSTPSVQKFTSRTRIRTSTTPTTVDTKYYLKTILKRPVSNDDSTENSINTEALLERNSHNVTDDHDLNLNAYPVEDSDNWKQIDFSDNYNEPIISPYKTLDNLRNTERVPSENVRQDIDAMSTISSTTKRYFSTTPKLDTFEQSKPNLSRKPSYYLYHVEDEVMADQTTEVLNGKVKSVIKSFISNFPSSSTSRHVEYTSTTPQTDDKVINIESQRIKHFPVEQPFRSHLQQLKVITESNMIRYVSPTGETITFTGPNRDTNNDYSSSTMPTIYSTSQRPLVDIETEAGLIDTVPSPDYVSEKGIYQSKFSTFAKGKSDIEKSRKYQSIINIEESPNDNIKIKSHENTDNIDVTPIVVVSSENVKAQTETEHPRLVNDYISDIASTTSTTKSTTTLKAVTETKPTTKSVSFPTRASRINPAIKLAAANLGGGRRSYQSSSNCSSDNSLQVNPKCNEIKYQRPNTSTRGRGSAHYSTSGASDSAQQTPNRGTPPTRSRPTLKPSTAIVAKVAEVDIYTNPPSRPAPVYPQPTPDKTAAKCRKDVCLLPDCFCGGKDIPGELPVDKIPQIVLLTFDDSVNDLNKGLYGDLFEKGRVNPNGCPISATFYVSHEWTDYSQVQNLYSAGHEMASHTVSHSFGEQFSQKKWNREIGGQREILAAYGGVKLEDVRGMRAPFLSVGGNKMFKMLYDSNFTYDSSLPVYENKPPSWPYTLDYKLFHDCMIPPCPTKSYPGVWEVPMVMWQDLNGGRCSMGDACANPPDSDGVYKMILKNFDRHYTSNRAPFGLFYHAAWFTQPHHKEGFIKFLDFINQMSDVWIVTNWQALQWVRDPTPISRMNNFQPFQCNYQDRPKKCNNPKVCNLWHKSGVRYMRTCQPCPEIYPWTGKTGIRSSRIDNDIEE